MFYLGYALCLWCDLLTACYLGPNESHSSGFVHEFVGIVQSGFDGCACLSDYLLGTVLVMVKLVCLFSGVVCLCSADISCYYDLLGSYGCTDGRPVVTTQLSAYFTSG